MTEVITGQQALPYDYVPGSAPGTKAVASTNITTYTGEVEDTDAGAHAGIADGLHLLPKNGEPLLPHLKDQATELAKRTYTSTVTPDKRQALNDLKSDVYSKDVPKNWDFIKSYLMRLAPTTPAGYLVYGTGLLVSVALATGIIGTLSLLTLGLLGSTGLLLVPLALTVGGLLLLLATSVFAASGVTGLLALLSSLATTFYAATSWVVRFAFNLVFGGRYTAGTVQVVHDIHHPGAYKVTIPQGSRVVVGDQNLADVHRGNMADVHRGKLA